MAIADTGLSIDMNFESLEGLIGNRGAAVVHEISAPCPCIRTDPAKGAVGHSDPNCALCLGQGRIFRDPRRMKGLLDSLSTNKQWSQVGWIQPGDAMFSPSTKARRINDFDRITLTVSLPVDGQVITRGQASALSPRPPGLLANEDLLYYESSRKEAALIVDSNGMTWLPGKYILDGRRIRWTDGVGPRVGSNYTIKYEAHPEMIAWATPFDRWDRQRELGQQVMLRKAAMDGNIGQQIREPWRERLHSNPMESTDAYGHYGILGRTTTDPPR